MERRHIEERGFTVNSRLGLSVDIGGTFTDIVLERGDQRRTKKVLTTPARPEEAVLTGIHEILLDASLALADVDIFVHGTTLATNAVIERRGAKVAMVTTQGFRDMLGIANESRYDQYELALDRPKPLVPRSMCFTLHERIDARGLVRVPLDEDEVIRLAEVLKRREVESVAIVFMHGYANPAHESRTAELLAARLPGIPLSLASQVCPEIREYERASTTVANAYLQPLVESYLSRMEEQLKRDGFRGAMCLMTSAGGLTSIETARRFPVRLVESGPAGGAIFGAGVAARLSERRAMAFDMGGTTAKVTIINDYVPQSLRLLEVAREARFLKGSGLPLRIPAIELMEIGAGGGSIASVDLLKRVKVGPESASAVPGPASYARGGTRPAVTDADVVLGLIDPSEFAGGTIPLRADLAQTALEESVGKPLRLSAEMAAYAVYEMVCENMASAARVHASERGAAAGEHTIIAFGGAAPLHVCRVAEKIGVRRIVVPPNAGVGSAIGFLAAPISFELIKSRYMQIESFDAEAASAHLSAMAGEIRGWVERAAQSAPTSERRQVFMRYIGQGHEISVDLPVRPLVREDRDLLRERFEEGYKALFSRFIPNASIELLSWSVTISTRTVLPKPIAAVSLGPTPKADSTAEFFDGKVGQRIRIPRYRRDKLPVGGQVPGPAVIVEHETSTFVSNSFNAWADAAGCIVMERKHV